MTTWKRCGRRRLGGPDECRAALGRLAIWLDQTAYQLAADGVDRAVHAPMKALAEEIRSAALPFDELRRRAVKLLEALAGPDAAPATPGVPGGLLVGLVGRLRLPRHGACSGSAADPAM